MITVRLHLTYGDRFGGMVQVKISQLMMAAGVAAAGLVGFGGTAAAAPGAGPAAIACANGEGVPVQLNSNDQSISAPVACDAPVCTEGVLTTVVDDSGVQHEACVASVAAVPPAPAAKAMLAPQTESAPTQPVGREQCGDVAPDRHRHRRSRDRCIAGRQRFRGLVAEPSQVLSRRPVDNRKGFDDKPATRSLPPVTKLVRIGVLGCGNVGSAFVKLVTAQQAMIEARTGVRLEVGAVAVRNLSRERDVRAAPTACSPATPTPWSPIRRSIWSSRSSAASSRPAS